MSVDRVHYREMKIRCSRVLTIIFMMDILGTIMMIRIREKNVDRSPRLTHLIRGMLCQ